MAEPEFVSDPRVLRAIAHPVRTRILDELEASGPVRAADIARELGIPANQASFHLRQLAKYGLVEEAPEEARDKSVAGHHAALTARALVPTPEAKAASWARLMSGELRVDSEPGQGSTFTVSLALAMVQHRSSIPAPPDTLAIARYEGRRHPPTR